jgi:hypothetical protein
MFYSFSNTNILSAYATANSGSPGTTLALNRATGSVYLHRLHCLGKNSTPSGASSKGSVRQALKSPAPSNLFGTGLKGMESSGLILQEAASANSSGVSPAESSFKY